MHFFRDIFRAPSTAHRPTILMHNDAEQDPFRTWNNNLHLIWVNPYNFNLQYLILRHTMTTIMDQLLSILPKQLLPCLALPLVELFPDLCLGWWTPPSLNLKQYNRMGYLRILLQTIAWYPVSCSLAMYVNQWLGFIAGFVYWWQHYGGFARDWIEIL